VAVRSSDGLLSLLTPATSFQRVTPFSWDIIPANTMAYDTLMLLEMKTMNSLTHHQPMRII
jgi:hypothetical protein